MANAKLLSSGLRKLVVLLGLLVASPLLVTFGFKALFKYKDTPDFLLAILLLAMASILIILTIIFAFKVFKTLIDAFFTE